jgi:hypothetical protein
MMPPADTTVKIAAAIGVSVEYLVTGKVIKAFASSERRKNQTAV